jgi:hypothetical protein
LKAAADKSLKHHFAAQLGVSFLLSMSGVSMKPEEKDNLKTIALMATGLLTEVALIQSMMRSKTLSIMVIVGAIFFVGFLYFLFNFA